MKTLFATILISAMAAASLGAQGGPPVDIPTRAQGASRVVQGTVYNVQSRFAQNEFGDQLIVSDVLFRVDEALKGPFTPVMAVTVEGGTVGSLTLDVSDMPDFAPGEQAVFFLDETGAGTYRLHRRDLGVLKLDQRGRVQGTTLSLDDVRSAIQSIR